MISGLKEVGSLVESLSDIGTNLARARDLLLKEEGNDALLCLYRANLQLRLALTCLKTESQLERGGKFQPKSVVTALDAMTQYPASYYAVLRASLERDWMSSDLGLRLLVDQSGIEGAWDRPAVTGLLEYMGRAGLLRSQKEFLGSTVTNYYWKPTELLKTLNRAGLIAILEEHANFEKGSKTEGLSKKIAYTCTDLPDLSSLGEQNERSLLWLYYRPNAVSLLKLIIHHDRQHQDDQVGIGTPELNIALGRRRVNNLTSRDLRLLELHGFVNVCKVPAHYPTMKGVWTVKVNHYKPSELATSEIAQKILKSADQE